LIQRDYSNRSFYDYYLKRGDKEAVQHTEEKKTDAGRPVYGGGGIDPDVVEKVRITPKELELQRAWFEPVFEFVHVLAAGEISGFPEYKIDKPADHHHRLQASEYQVSDKLMDAFKAFMTERKDLKADVARIDRETDFLKRWIRYELVTAAYGTETAFQVLLETDNQVQKAVGEIPKARMMAEDARRTHAARNNE
jgi:carboxyl-terminal processing protease